jgi:hypothetical protein
MAKRRCSPSKFAADVKEWRRACAAQGWYWTREQQADPLGDNYQPPSIRSSAILPQALYESTLQDACVMDWTHDEATIELIARPGDQPGPPKPGLLD